LKERNINKNVFHASPQTEEGQKEKKKEKGKRMLLVCL
jgi:hypothetical protein